MFQLSKTINFSGTHYNGVYYKHGIKLLKD